MRTKAEMTLLLDPEINQGNKYPGIEGAVTDAQNRLEPSHTFPVRIVVHKKLYDYLRGNPWQFDIITDDSGLPNTQRGIIKISW